MADSIPTACARLPGEQRLGHHLPWCGHPHPASSKTAHGREEMSPKWITNIAKAICHMSYVMCHMSYGLCHAYIVRAHNHTISKEWTWNGIALRSLVWRFLLILCLWLFYHQRIIFFWLLTVQRKKSITIACKKSSGKNVGNHWRR